MLSSCFPGARLDLSDEDNAVALALTECSARSYTELIKSNIPSSSSLMSTRSSASRPPPPFANGVSSFGPTAAAPTRGEILVHLGTTSRKPRSEKRKNPNSSEKDRSVPAKVQKLGVSPPLPVRELEQASPPLADVQNSGASPPSPAQELEPASSPLIEVQELGASPPSPAQEPEQASSPLVLTLLSPPKPVVKAKGLSSAAVALPLTALPITIWNPPSDNAKSPPRGMAEPMRKKSKQVKDSLLSNPKFATGAISSILLESDVGSSKELPVDEALALSFQGVASVSL